MVSPRLPPLTLLTRLTSDVAFFTDVGVNPRAVICWALAVFPSMPGFVSSVTKGRIAVPIGWVHTSYLAWILGTYLQRSLVSSTSVLILTSLGCARFQAT